MKNNEGFLKHDKMTAKEFLREFGLWIETGGLVEENPKRTEQDWEDQIDSFLEEFHKTYVPITRWIVKGETVWHCEHGVKHPNNYEEE